MNETNSENGQSIETDAELASVGVGATALQLDAIPGFLQDTVASIIAFLPRLVAALVILLIGWIIGRVVAGVVRRVVDAVDLDRMVLDTPLGRMLGGTQNAVSSAFGKVAAWFVYALAILTAADALAIPLLSRWIARAQCRTCRRSWPACWSS